MAPRKHIFLTLRGWLLHAAGILSYGLAAGVAVTTVVGGRRLLRLVGDHSDAGQVLLAVGFVVALILLPVGHRFSLRGRRLLAKAQSLRHTEFLGDEDSRPVVYLRSFSDDDPMSYTPVAFAFRDVVELPSLATEEEHLAKALEGLGPFLAVANPCEGLPQLGAVRIQADEEAWQESVIHLIDCARLVVFRVGDGKWLWWEIEQAIERLSPKRLLFLIPDDEGLYDRFRQRLGDLLSQEIPELPHAASLPTSLVAILFFDSDGAARLGPLRSIELRTSPSQPLVAPLLVELRPVFEQLGIEWAAPPVPLSAFARVAGRLSVFGFILSCLVVLFVAWARSGSSIALFFIVAWLSYLTVRWGWGSWVSGAQLIASLRWCYPEGRARYLSSPAPRILKFLETTQRAWAAGLVSKSVNEHVESVDDYIEDSRLSRWRFLGKYLPEEGGVLNLLAECFPPQDDEFLVAFGEEDRPGLLGRYGWFVLTNRRLIQRDGRDNAFRAVQLRDVQRFEVTGLLTHRVFFKMTTKEEVKFERTDLCPTEEELAEAVRLATL